MGERTSALVSSRTAAPRNNLVANSEALAWSAHSDWSRIPDVPPMVYPRDPLLIESRNIADLLAQSRSDEASEKIAKLAMDQPVYKLPEKLPEPNFPEPYNSETGTAMALAVALMITDERPAANCCPCLPCNLL